MNRIKWAGSSKIWSPPEPPAIARYAVPLVEEQVLSVAFDPEFLSYGRLSKSCAINCTSRLAQRVALSQTGLNPRWSPFSWTPGVVKAPASCQNNGVRFFDTSEHVWLLSQYAPELAGTGVIEERLFGEAYELDGAKFGNKLLFFAPLHQRWNEKFDKVLAYERTEAPEGIYDAAARAIGAVGIDYCCFCIEFRRHGGAWKVVEIHARLGEDTGLAEKMSDSDPLERVERLCSFAAASPAVERDRIGSQLFG